jgi:palmitoyl-protein thioesterase
MLAARAARAGIYSTYAQNHLIQAQYYRDVERLDEFWDVNTFLTGLNNDHGPDQSLSAVENASGKGRLDGLESFVAVMFDADRAYAILVKNNTVKACNIIDAEATGTVSPAQSAHFWTYAPGNKTVLVPLEEQGIYTQDRIGLRKLDEDGRLFLEHCPGEHMDLDSGDCANKVVQRWVGSRV